MKLGCPICSFFFESVHLFGLDATARFNPGMNYIWMLSVSMRLFVSNTCEMNVLRYLKLKEDFLQDHIYFEKNLSGSGSALATHTFLFPTKPFFLNISLINFFLRFFF